MDKSVHYLYINIIKSFNTIQYNQLKMNILIHDKCNYTYYIKSKELLL